MRSLSFAAGLVCGILIAIGFPSRAQLSVSVFGLSRHSQPGYCEVNPGFGLNYNMTRDWRLLAGRYENSKCKSSDVEAIIYCGLRAGSFCAGAGVARLTGYAERALYVPLPTVSYERPNYALDFVGGAYQRKAVIALGLRFPL